MRRLALMVLVGSGCAQLQAQRGPSWLRAQQGWAADRIVCLGHSGADGGVRAADWAAARCTAGIANAWLNPVISANIKEQAKAERTFIALTRLAKVTDRYTDPATGEVVSRMELTAEEVDRQLQREFMDEQELLGSLRAEIVQGAKGVKAEPMDPKWLKDQWAKLEPQAELSERVQRDLEAQQAAQVEAKKAEEKAEDKAPAASAQPAAPSANSAVQKPAKAKAESAKPAPAAVPQAKAPQDAAKTKKVNKGAASKSKAAAKAKPTKNSKEDVKSPKTAPKAPSKKD